MGMVRRGNGDGLDVFLLVEHLAKIGVLGQLGMGIEDVARTLAIDIAKGNDVLAADVAVIARPLPGAADDCDVQSFVGSAAWLASEGFGDAAGQPEPRRGRRYAAGLQKLAAIDFSTHGRLLCESRNGRTLWIGDSL